MAAKEIRLTELELNALEGAVALRQVSVQQVVEAIVTQRAAQAWAEGFKQGGPMHDVNYDDPDAHKRNPYTEEA